MRIGVFAALLLLATGTTVAAGPARRTLTFEDRVNAQKIIEQVYWNHRIWPKGNPTPKPALSAVMPDEAIRAKIEDSLKKSNALDRYWLGPITGEQLQREMDRMARESNDRKVLRELFEALGNDPVLIAETLVRPVLADRLARNWYEGNATLRDAGASETFDAWWNRRRAVFVADSTIASDHYVLPKIDAPSCTRDTWSLTHTDVPDGRVEHFAVWTGAEMVVWGGININGYLVTGGRYDPATDIWIATSVTADVPMRHRFGTAVWTGTEMIVWGGWTLNTTASNTGARYNPSTDTWRATAVGANVPTARSNHTAVWTGTEMIVWGGTSSNTGGRYNPVSDSWLPTSTGANTPAARTAHTAVWTGSEMIVWGGNVSSGGSQSGARYNPTSDSWLPVTASGAPDWRSAHTAVGTGTEMIVWGGSLASGGTTNTGGRYSPATDSWVSTSTLGAPAAGNDYFAVWTGSRMLEWNGAGAAYDPSTNTWATMAAAPLPFAFGRTVIWTGQEMIAWGGSGGTYLNSGARYRPSTNSWVPTSTASTVPPPRYSAPSVWTGAELVAWGGYLSSTNGPATNTGGRYSPATDSWLPTSTGPNVPTKRFEYTSVWTGHEMIIWGGAGDGTGPSVSTNPGARYDPMTDTWNAMATGANAPGLRLDASAVWTGTEMIVWGGWTNAGGACGGRYDPVSDSWQPTSTENEPFCDGAPAAAWTGTEMIVYGGRSTFGGRYNPGSDTWSAMSAVSAPSPRFDFTSVWTGRQLIIWGGHVSPSGGVLNSGGRYDAATDTWLATSTNANVPPPCDYPVAVWTGLEMLVYNPCGPDGDHVSVGARYDPAADAWLPMTSWPLRTSYLDHGSAVWTGDQMLIWVGTDLYAGASYCACPRLHTVYRDADDDGFGDATAPVTTCDDLPPAGFAEDATDCDDTNSAIHPAAEVGTTLLSGEHGTTLAWPAVDGSVVYDVASSTILDLHANGTATAGCLSNDVHGTSYEDERAEPDPGDGYYYLVRARSACGAGSYGVDSLGAERVPTVACP